MRKILFLFAVFTVVLSNSKAQIYEKTDWGIKSTVLSVNLEIQLYGPSTVRVLKWPVGKMFTKESLSVVAKPQKIKFDVKQTGDVVSIKTEKIKIDLNIKSGQFSFFTSQGKSIVTENSAGSFTAFSDAGNQTYTISQSFALNTNEFIYGLGQQQQGKMSQRNVKLNMIQGNTDDYIPFFLSSKGYGVFWDNYSPTVFEDHEKTTTFRSDVGDGIDYYVMYGENADGVTACMRGLTGQVPMFPLWTFGYWQSKERYKSQDEIANVVEKYRELQVPLDGIIQDWQYWGNNYLWNSMEFLNPDYSDPQKMVNDIHRMNAHLIISIWSSFGPQTKQYREMAPKGMLLNFETWPQSGVETWPPKMDYPSGVKPYDPYNPEARDIYWKHLNSGLFSVGMDGWWMDSSEPDHLSFKPSDFDNPTYLGSFRKVRNAFPLMTVGGVSQHQKATSTDKRVFILTRSAFAGQQRYGANTWSGDVTASWEALKNQISAGLNFSLCAIPYWNSDIGGFFLNRFKGKLNDAEYRELYVRWLQFGTFCAMMRSHGTDAPREIYQFGQKGEKSYDAIEKYIHLRYLLLPYIYSTSWEITSKQSSMMRALVMDFPNDTQALDINDEYMFGKSILVCPVTHCMYSRDSKEDFTSTKSKELYLPKGSEWYDYWTNNRITGGQTIQKEAPLDIIPLYIKAGTILPLGPNVQYATEKKWDDLEIRIYEGENGEFTLYEDENDNYNYEKGAYSTIVFTWNNAHKELVIGNRTGSFPGMLASRKFHLKLITKGCSENTDLNSTQKEILYTGKKTIMKF